MNAIRNYLDNMFRNLPNTEEVRRAKAELLQMMEDKYEELISEGKTENEAVGIVISEFGNLDELAESLGISEAVTENPDEAKPMLSMDRVKDYLSMISTRSILTPLGIALCIFSVAMNIVAEVAGLPEEILGVGGMFGAIGVAVGLFIISGIKNKEYAEVKRKDCSLSIECAEYVRNERKGYKHIYGLMSSFGIGLCILSVLNPIIFDKIPYLSSDFGAVMFFAFVSAGVFLITCANTKMNGYDRLLQLNEAGKMSEEFVPKSDRKVNKTPIIICAIVAAVVVVLTFFTRIAVPLFTGVFIKDDIFETVATTYELEDGNSASVKEGDVNSVKLDMAACSVNLEVKEGSGLISIDYSGDTRLKPDVSFENGKLVVTQKGSKFRLNFGTTGLNSPKLNIVLGTDVDLSNLEMQVDAGDINMKGIKADYFFGDFDAGNIIIRDCTFSKADIEADAGNIQIDDSDCRRLKIETDAGNIEISNTILENIDVDTDFGNVEIHDIDDLDAYDIDCHVDAGIIQVGNSSSGKNFNSNGNGTGSIKVNVDAGNIEIK
ncbi:MAG: DUF4097 domain-containing protein [Saccharofermentans sp.]|nr:DUF4097 domain-containing protein [Saccharofermentans sp.]